MNSLGFLTISATVIGLITLIGAAIGLMNIMLVSVSERTKEVGLDKGHRGKKQNGEAAISAGSDHYQCAGRPIRDYYWGWSVICFRLC